MRRSNSRSRAAIALVAAVSGLALVSCTKARDVVGSAAPQTSGPTVIVPPRETTTTSATSPPTTRPGGGQGTQPGGASTTVPGGTVTLVPAPGGGGPTGPTSTLVGGGSTQANGAGGSGGSGGSGAGGSLGAGGTGTTSPSGGSATTRPTAVTSPPTTATAPPTTADSGIAQHERTRLGKQPSGEERLVFDFINRAPSSTDVRYVTGPILAPGSGAPVTVQGDNVLLVTMADATGAGSYVGNGYLSQATMQQWGFTAVVEARLVGDAGGQLQWAIGVKGRPRFTIDRYDTRFIVQVYP